MPKSITIVDIAKEAGVSISTVSRVLTGNAKVSGEKEKKIREIIQKYDFQPNVLARGLINARSNLIGILTADIRNPFYSTMFVSCEQAAAQYGYSIMLCNSFADRLNEFILLDKLSQQKVDAIVLIGGVVDDVNTDQEFADKINAISAEIPVLVTGNLQGSRCTKINIDTKKAIELVMNFITRHPDFKKVAFAGGSKKVASTSTKRTAFREFLSKSHLEYIPEFDVENDHYDEEGGYEAMNAILKNGTPDVVIAVNDISAVGVIRSIHEHKLRIPEDISLISFDNTYISTLTNPQLTTVSYNYRNYGLKIISSALDLINKKDVPEEILIEPQLIIRDSCV